MQRIKIIAAAALTILLLVVIAQNAEPVETRLLFATVTMPGAALLAIAGIVGFAIGLLTALWVSRRSSD